MRKNLGLDKWYNGIKEGFHKEVDNEMIKSINEEIDANRTVRGQFQTTEVEGQTVGEETET